MLRAWAMSIENYRVRTAFALVGAVFTVLLAPWAFALLIAAPSDPQDSLQSAALGLGISNNALECSTNSLGA
jgi:hypothetical protein